MGIEGEPGFVADIDNTKIVASAGNLSMNTRSEDPMKRIKSTGLRTSLASADAAGGKKMATSVTVSFQFRSQLDILLLNLRSTSPHYIKCVKPNSEKAPGRFNAEMMSEQLRYSGALKVVRIRQEGFPISLSFAQFYEMFENLGFKRGWKKSRLCTTPEAREYTAALCSEYLKHKQEYQLGFTKVFMKSDSFEHMHLAINVFFAQKVRKFQALARQRIAWVRYRTSRKGILLFQAWVRMYLARKRFKKIMQNLFEAREREQIRLTEERRLANLAYVERVEGLFLAVSAGDLATVRALLSAYPEDYYLCDEKQNNRSVLQAACRSGNVDLIRHLQPSRDDIFYKDSHGNNAVHYVMFSGKKSILSILRYLSIVNAADTENLRDVVAAMQQMSIEPRRASALPPVAPTSANMTRSPHAMPVQEIRPMLPPPAPALSEDDEVVSTITGATAASSATKSSASLGRAHGTGSGGSAELKSGWLSKRGESQIWRKRWVVLTTEALMYFRNNKDKLPRYTLSFTHQNDITIQRSPGKTTAIDIFINTQSIKKKRDRVSLMADTEQEMQAWMNLLKAAAGVQSQPLRTAGSSAASALANKNNKDVKPLLVLRPTWTSLLLKSVNNAHETPLHILAQYDAATAAANDGMTEEDILILATWMVGNIAPLNAYNGRGLTPLQVAVQASNQSLAALLTKQGADPSKTMFGSSGTRSTYDLAQDIEFQKRLKAATRAFAQRENFSIDSSSTARLSLFFHRLLSRSNKSFGRLHCS
jgi:hypothetical protein